MHMPFLNGDVHNYYMAATATVSKLADSPVVRSVLGAAVAAIFSSVITAHAMLSRLDEKVIAMQVRFDENVGAIYRRIQEHQEGSVSFRDRLIKHRDGQIEDIKKDIYELRGRIRQLENGKKP